DRGRVHSDPGVNDFADTHSLVLLVDSLSLMTALERLDPGFTAETGRQLLTAASNSRASFTSSLDFPQGKSEGDTLERMLDAFRDLLLGARQQQTVVYGDTLLGNTWHLENLRKPFHENLAELNEKIDELIGFTGAQYSIHPIPQLGSSGIAGLAALDDDTGKAVRYALATMNPFYVEGPASLYDPHNARGELDLYARDTSPAGMTPSYIA